jgi:hypothetical protein
LVSSVLRNFDDAAEAAELADEAGNPAGEVTAGAVEGAIRIFDGAEDAAGGVDPFIEVDGFLDAVATTDPGGHGEREEGTKREEGTGANGAWFCEGNVKVF